MKQPVRVRFLQPESCLPDGFACLADRQRTAFTHQPGGWAGDSWTVPPLSRTETHAAAAVNRSRRISRGTASMSQSSRRSGSRG